MVIQSNQDRPPQFVLETATPFVRSQIGGRGLVGNEGMEMAKRLYKIEYEGTVYVVGEGPFDAEDIAMKAIRDDASACAEWAKE